MGKLHLPLVLLAMLLIGMTAVEGADLAAVLSSAQEETAPVIKQTFETARGGRITIKYRAVRWDRKITDSLRDDTEIRSHLNENYLWKLAEIETNAAIYSDGVSIQAGKYWVGFITTGYDWYVVVTNENGQRIVEELVSVEDYGVWVPRLVMSVEPGDLNNDAVLVVKYGTKAVRLPFTIGQPVSSGSDSRSR